MAVAGRARARVLGVSHEYPDMVSLPVSEGRFFDAADEEAYGQVAVIGQEARAAWFGFPPAVGPALKVDNQWLTVIGVLAPGVAGNDVYLPVTTAARKFGRPATRSPLDEMTVRVTPGVSVQESAKVIASLLDRLHGGAADYAITVPEALLEQSRRTQRLFDIVMGTIASISLLVGGIGIMNIMLATVLERTREIGVRRALGARRSDIRNQFVVESFAISLIGGLAGIAAGLAISRGVAVYAGWETVVTGG